MIATDATSSTAGALNAVSSTFQIENADDYGVQVTGTWAGTLTFQTSIDGTNWVTTAVQPVGATTSTTWVTTTTANGIWGRPAGGLKYADRKSTRLNSSHSQQSRMPSSA